MTWIVELSGDQHSLRALEEFFPLDAIVIASDDKYRLAPVLFTDVDEYQEVEKIAKQEVDLLNGYLKVFLPNRMRIALGHISRHDPGKPKVHYVSVVENIGVSASIVGLKLGDEEAIFMKPDHGPGLQQWREIVRQDETVRDVFEYLQGALNDWSNLGRIIEAIEHDLGGREKLLATGWADSESLKSFGATANNPRVAGATARHGARRFDPPKKPMEIHQARIMVLEVARHWIVAKINGRQ
ncbi:MAG: hypothetical protein ACOY82_02670 [Pseudomonadota bacterium]|jgi:hypothetical protein